MIIGKKNFKKWLILSNITLRDYQKDTLQAVEESFNRGIQRQLIVKSTGLGKTVTLVFLIRRYLKEGRNVLVLADQSDLVWQWRDRIHEIDPTIKVDIEKADHYANTRSGLVIATPQTLGRKGRKRIKRFDPDHFDLAIADEADKSITPTWIRVLEYFGFGKENLAEGNLLAGCTATPFRSSGESMGILYDDIVVNYDIRYAISEGWLTDIELYDVSTDTDISGVTSYGDKFNQTELAETVDNDLRNEEVIKAYKDIVAPKQAIVYCASVDHAYHLTELFKMNGVDACVIEAETDKDKRRKLVSDFRAGRIDVICNHSTMTRGIDFPELQAIMFARPVKSKNLFIQILGRVLRPSQTAFVDVWGNRASRLEAIENSVKPAATVIDFYDKAGSHNIAHVPSLFGLHDELRPKERKKFFKEVVEPLEEKKREHGIDISKVRDLDEVELLVKNRKVDIKSYKPDPKIKDFTRRKWLKTGDESYEIIYGEENRALLIEKNQAKDDLVGRKEWKLYEHNTKDNITKELQTFNSLGGAFKIADEYADRQGWSKKFKERGGWESQGVTEDQMKLLERFFSYKTGYKKYRLLNERYDDTGLRKVYWKESAETLDRGAASALLDSFFNS